MKIIITKDGHGFKTGEKKDVNVKLATSLMASNAADEDGVNEIKISTLAPLARRNLQGLARCRKIEGYLGMSHGKLLTAITAPPKKKGSAK